MDIWVIGTFLMATMVSVITIIVIVLWERHRFLLRKRRTEQEVQNIIKIQRISDEAKNEVLRKWQ